MPKIERLQDCIKIVMDNGNVVILSNGGKGVFDKNGKRLFCGRGGNSYNMYKDLSDDEILKKFMNS